MTNYGATAAGFRRKRSDEILESLRLRARQPEYFGPEADLSPYGPLGVLIDLAAHEISAAWEGLEANYNEAYIDTASGVALDRVCRIAGATRRARVRYTTRLEITGADWSLVPAGFEVQTPGGTRYRTIDDVTISGGVAEVTAEAVDYGFASAVLAGQLTQIVTPLVGVYEAVNVTDATGGNPTEPDRELRAKAIELAALNTKDVGALTEIRILIESAGDIRTCKITENSLPVSFAGMLPNSMTFVVDGGSDEYVAELIFRYKQGGVGLNGSIALTIFDDAGNPHLIRFSRPTVVLVYLLVTVQSGDGWVSSNVRDIQQRLIERIGGTDTFTSGGEVISNDYAGLRAGDDVLPLPLYAALSGLPGLVNATIAMGRSAGAIDQVSLAMADAELARAYTANITVQVL